MENNNINLIDGNSLKRKSKSDFNLSLSQTNISWKSLQMSQRLSHNIRIEEIVPIESEFLRPQNSDGKSWKINVENFSSRKRGDRSEDKKLSKSVRRYYKDQDLLITTFEDFAQEKFNDEDEYAPLAKRVSILAKLSFACNLLLLGSKSIAAVLSKSLSVITSVIDSLVDLVSGALMWWSSRAIRKRDPYLYPQGRTRLEPVAIVVLSVVMSLASVAMIQQSIETIIEYIQYDIQNSTLHNASLVLCISIGEMTDLIHLKGAHGPVFELDSIIICVTTIVLKFVLYLLCRRCPAPSTMALAQDHRNDVVSNTAALLCGYIAYKFWKYTDPIGAILISFYIIVSWYKTGCEQIKLLTGHTARPDFLKKLTWLALNHHEEILFIDTIRAFHFGNNFLVEVDIVLPRKMAMQEAHDIGETLQIKLEKLQEVERAFVHIDYEIDHHPTAEHKVV